MSAGATDNPDAVVGAAPRHWTSRAGTAVAVIVSATSATAAVYVGAAAEEPHGAVVAGWYVLGLLVGLALAGLLVLRRRCPVVLCVVASAAALLLPIDASAALLSLPWVIATAPVRTSAAGVVLTGGATAVALARDATRDPGLMFYATFDEDTRAVMSHPGPSTFVIVGTALLGISVAAGLVRRSRALAARAQEQHEAQATATAVLRDQMTRQEERRLIAREVHDTVAHHIAAISLQASALEVTHAEDPDARRAAREMRASAQEAIAELRHLVTALRSGRAVTWNPGTTLDDLRPLLAQLHEDGMSLTSSVSVDAAGDASPALTRAAFRIVQEAVTNARKHAPGARADVTVDVGPDRGVTIRVTNPLGPPTPTQGQGGAADDRGPGAVPGTGTGLLGMHERADAVGGTLEAGQVGGEFVVRARLPWIPGGEPTTASLSD